MENKEFVLASGTLLQITVAPFEDINALFKAVIRTTSGIDLKGEMAKFETGLAVAISDEVEKAMFRCASRATYEGQRVTKALFDDPLLGMKARGDYFEIAGKVIEVNCEPFFKSTSSKSSASTRTPPESPK